MRILTNLRSMPTPLLGLFLVFLAVPALSLGWLRPWDQMVNPAVWKMALLILTYVLLPMAVCISLLFRYYWFFPLYFAECVLLGLHASVSQQVFEVQMARFLLIGLMIYVGLLFGNKNILYPLLSKTIRFWRKAPRFRIGREVGVKVNGEFVPALLKDGSKTGMQLAIHQDDLPSDGMDGAFQVALDQDGKEILVTVKQVWVKEDEAERCFRIGCVVLEKATMAAFLKNEIAKHRATLQLPELKDFAVHRDIQETALVLWLVCIALSFALPAFGMG